MFEDTFSNQFREDVGSVNPFGEPFLNVVPGYLEKFTIPFVLGGKDEYLLWLFHFIGQLRTQYGENVANYVVEYINGNDVLHSLFASEKERVKTYDLASSVIYTTLGYGVCMAYDTEYCDRALKPMDCFRKFHQEFCKYKLDDLEQWFCHWAVVLKILEIEGVDEAYEFSQELNGFTFEEFDLMLDIDCRIEDPKELIRRHLKTIGSDHIDVSKRAYDVNSKNGQPSLHRKAIEGSWFLSKQMSMVLGH